MLNQTIPLTAERWLLINASGPIERIEKETPGTKAWFAEIDGVEIFAKLYPPALERWATSEKRISGANLHPSIIRLDRIVQVAEGELYIYPKMQGANFGSSETRKQFLKLPVDQRAAAIISIMEALDAIGDSGFTVVDWYEGNMIYDFESGEMWLFDWELCVPNTSFILETESNYGASRLMAPEEFVKGSVIDQQTLVFNLGRFVLLYLPDLADFLGPILSRATYPSRPNRYPTVRSFLSKFRDSINEIASEISPAP